MTFNYLSTCMLFASLYNLTLFSADATHQLPSLSHISNRLTALYAEKEDLPEDAVFDTHKQTEIDLLTAQLQIVYAQKTASTQSTCWSELTFCRQENARLQKQVRTLQWTSAGMGLLAAILISKEVVIRNPQIVEKIGKLCTY